jgi:hypothetical protein
MTHTPRGHARAGTRRASTGHGGGADARERAPKLSANVAAVFLHRVEALISRASGIHAKFRWRVHNRRTIEGLGGNHEVSHHSFQWRGRGDRWRCDACRFECAGLSLHPFRALPAGGHRRERRTRLQAWGLARRLAWGLARRLARGLASLGLGRWLALLVDSVGCPPLWMGLRLTACPPPVSQRKLTVARTSRRR